MWARRLLLYALLSSAFASLPSCAMVEYEIWRAKIRENRIDLYRGKDRGYDGYRKILEESTIRGSQVRRYRYVKPAHVSNYLVTRAVRGLGGTRWPDNRRNINTDAMAGTVERLLDVLYRDPTPSVREQVCSQLGRVSRRITMGAYPGAMDPGNDTGLLALEDPYRLVRHADTRIAQTTSDLAELQQRIKNGEKIAPKFIVAALEEFAQNPPHQSTTALDMLTAISSPPIENSTEGTVRDAARAIVPRLCLRAISVSLTELACGSLVEFGASPDESDRVRVRALQVLTALRDPTAREVAAARISQPLDPDESDMSVQSALLVYLGTIGGPSAFEAAVQRLDNGQTSIRFHAQSALIAMTGARVQSDASVWRTWRSKNPKWQFSDTGRLREAEGPRGPGELRREDDARPISTVLATGSNR